MNKIFNFTSSFKNIQETEKGLSISGMASTNDFDRAGDVILSDAWTKGGLNNFNKNPVILFNHNYDAPIGKATRIEASAKGLELDVAISGSAPGGIAGLIKDGVLGAFSVGFRIKDADYIEETGGLLIKDAELFEVSVVSVPCNQDATFSVAKSFDSEKDYEEFKQTFTNSVDLAGQSLAKDESNDSNIASHTPDGADAQLEIKMNKEEMEAIAKAAAEKAAEATGRAFAMKQAEKEAAEKAAAEATAEAAAKKAADEAAVIKTVTSGTEQLMADIDAKLAAKDADFTAIVETLKTELAEKADEIAKLNDSKRLFADRGTSAEGITKWGAEFLQAHMLGVITGKGWNTDFAADIAQKAGVDYSDATDLDQEISNQIEKEVQMYTRVSELFRKIKVNGAATVLPIQPDADVAVWQTGAAVAGNLNSMVGKTPDTGFSPKQVILNAYRLISQTFLDNNTDEQILINLMPMIIDSVARAHARAVEAVCLNGNGTIEGLDQYAAANIVADDDLATVAEAVTAAHLMTLRSQMGKYGVSPDDVTYIVSLGRYYELIEDPAFSDVSEVGPQAHKVKGSVGSVYGSQIVVSDEFPTEAAGIPVAFAVNTRNFAIPTLRSIKVEQDYEVGNQRRVVVASQALGFEELVTPYVGGQSSVKLDITA
jgi:HK97 family phage prohead protease